MAEVMEKEQVSSVFNLSLPTEEEVKQELVVALAPSEKEKETIVTKTDSVVENIMNVDLENYEKRKEITDVISNFGLEDLKASQTKNDLLAKRMGNLSKMGTTAGLGEAGDVAKGLEDLTIKMRDLDPSGIDFMKTGPLGKLFNPVRRYFEKYKTADQEISEIVKSLEKGKKTLVADNTTLEIEETNLRVLAKKMEQNIVFGQQIDEQLSVAIEQARATGVDEDKIKFVEEEILYPLRQRIQDFQQVELVSQQGVISMALIRHNNRELIRSVDSAKYTTVTALRTAVTVASALYNQKIVLEKVTALNETTNHMIESTSKMLRTQGVAIQKQASEAAISPETLKAAFAETLQALDDISAYRQEALPRMKETIATFNELAVQGSAKISEMEQRGMLLGEK